MTLDCCLTESPIDIDMMHKISRDVAVTHMSSSGENAMEEARQRE